MKAFLCLIVGLAVVPRFSTVTAAENQGNDALGGAGVSETQAAVVAPPLSPGVADIAKMVQAKVDEPVVLAYINNSGTVYSLDPDQIIYLRNIGASQTVISTMLDQRQKYATQPAPPADQSAPAAPQSTTTAYNPANYAPAATAYAPPEPAPAPVSTVYVIPYYSGGYRNYGYGYGYYNYYPSYYPRYSACYNGFGYYGYRPGGYAVGFHYSTPNHFVAVGGFHSQGGSSHWHH